MMRVRHSSPTRTFVVPLTLVCFLGACYKYTPVEQSSWASASQPDQIRVTVTDGSTFSVNEPRIEGEALAGESEPCPGSLTETSCDASFAFSEITQVEQREKNGSATTWLIVGVSLAGIGLGLVVVWLAACSGGACS